MTPTLTSPVAYAAVVPRSRPYALFPRLSALALLLILAAAVLLYASTTRWAQTAFELAVFILAAAWTLYLLRSSSRPAFSPVLLPLALAAAWPVLQLMTGAAVYPYVTRAAVLAWTSCLVLFFLALQIFSDLRLRQGFLQALLLFGFLLTLASLIQFFIAPGKLFFLFDTHVPTSIGPFVNRDHHAAFVELLLPIALLNAFRERRRLWFHATVVGTLYASVIGGASRAGAILVSLEVLVLVLLASTRRALPGNTLRRAAALLAVCVLSYSAVVGWKVLLNRFDDPDPFQHRREMLLSASHMVRERPWLGFGLGSWETAYPAYALMDSGAIVGHAHNDWAQFAAEGGIPFLLTVLAIPALTFKPALRSLWGLGPFFLLLHSLVDFPMQIPALAALVFTILAAVVSNDKA